MLFESRKCVELFLLHAAESSDAVFDRRMRHEELGKMLALERVGDIEVRRGAVGGLERLGIAGDLLQSAGQPLRIAREKRSGSIGQELALPRDGKLQEHGEERRQDGEDDRRDEEKRLGLAPVIVVAVAKESEVAEPVGEKRHESDQDDYDGRG